MKLERVHRCNAREEVIEELEREYDMTVTQLKELERSTEARRRREIQTLRRYAADTGDFETTLKALSELNEHYF